MKRINILILSSLIIGFFAFISCNDTDNPDPIDTHEDAYVDVIVKKVNAMGNPKYKLMFFAGGAEISATGSTVTTPDGNTFPMNQFWAGPGILTNGDDELKDAKPVTGEFTFSLKFDDGFIKELKDIVTETEIGMISNITVDHEANSNDISVTWEGGVGSDLICLKLTEIDIANTKPLFKIAGMPKTQTEYSFNTTTSTMPGWMRSPDELVRGTEYWLVVSGKKVEEGTTPSGASKNFEMNSCAKVKIVW